MRGRHATLSPSGAQTSPFLQLVDTHVVPSSVQLRTSKDDPVAHCRDFGAHTSGRQAVAPSDATHVRPLPHTSSTSKPEPSPRQRSRDAPSQRACPATQDSTRGPSTGPSPPGIVSPREGGLDSKRDSGWAPHPTGRRAARKTVVRVQVFIAWTLLSKGCAPPASPLRAAFRGQHPRAYCPHLRHLAERARGARAEKTVANCPGWSMDARIARWSRWIR